MTDQIEGPSGPQQFAVTLGGQVHHHHPVGPDDQDQPEPGQLDVVGLDECQPVWYVEKSTSHSHSPVPTQGVTPVPFGAEVTEQFYVHDTPRSLAPALTLRQVQLPDRPWPMFASVIVATGTNEDGAKVTFAMEHRAARDLFWVLKDDPDAAVAVEDRQVLK